MKPPVGAPVVYMGHKYRVRLVLEHELLVALPPARNPTHVLAAADYTYDKRIGVWRVTPPSALGVIPDDKRAAFAEQVRSAS